VVIGSQAVLGQFPDAPAELLVSYEADLFTFRSPEDADLIDGSIGESSPFHKSFGYYAHGVGEETAILPSGWKDRLVPIRNQNMGSGVGLCLEVHDLTVSKLIAGREKDLDFIKGLLNHRMAQAEVVLSRLDATPISNEVRGLCRARLQRLT